MSSDKSAANVGRATADLYLSLLRQILLRDGFPEHYGEPKPPTSQKERVVRRIAAWALARQGLLVARPITVDAEARRLGKDWPEQAETMIGSIRLEHLQQCVRTVVEENVPGDLIETGVWRGGAIILIRAALEAYGDTHRTVWAADSFSGLPPPNAYLYEADRNDPHWTFSELAVSLKQVKANIARYGLLDDRVRFLEGWFSDTLPEAETGPLSLIRLDGDMYESTMDGLVNLYPRLSLGGFLIVDDWGAVPACRQAVLDYRAKQHIEAEIIAVDWGGVFWRRAT